MLRDSPRLGNKGVAMDNRRPGMAPTLVGSLAAFLLQVMIAPALAVNDVVPNLMLVFVVLTAMTHDTTRATAVGFVLGLLYDFVSQGPIGTMTLVFTLLGYSVSSLNKGMFSENWIIELVTLFVAAFFGELLHSVVLAIIGYDGDFLSSLVMRALPGMVYDTVFGLILFPILSLVSRRTRRRDFGALKRKLH